MTWIMTSLILAFFFFLPLSVSLPFQINYLAPGSPLGNPKLNHPLKQQKLLKWQDAKYVQKGVEFKIVRQLCKAIHNSTYHHCKH